MVNNSLSTSALDPHRRPLARPPAEPILTHLNHLFRPTTPRLHGQPLALTPSVYARPHASLDAALYDGVHAGAVGKWDDFSHGRGKG